MQDSMIAARLWSKPAAIIEKAIAVLRKKGQAAAAKKATREATEGLVGSYIHAGGKIGVLVEVNCESDFVARTEAFQHLCHDIAMHIAALDPRYVRREEVTPEMLEKEREIYRAQALATGKPEPVVEKIVTGKMEKFYEDNCLYEQHYIKDEGTTIREMVASAIAKLGENISIKRFCEVQGWRSDGNGSDRRRLRFLRQSKLDSCFWKRFSAPRFWPGRFFGGAEHVR